MWKNVLLVKQHQREVCNYYKLRRQQKCFWIFMMSFFLAPAFMMVVVSINTMMCLVCWNYSGMVWEAVGFQRFLKIELNWAGDIWPMGAPHPANPPPRIWGIWCQQSPAFNGSEMFGSNLHNNRQVVLMLWLTGVNGQNNKWSVFWLVQQR